MEVIQKYTNRRSTRRFWVRTSRQNTRRDKNSRKKTWRQSEINKNKQSLGVQPFRIKAFVRQTGASKSINSTYCGASHPAAAFITLMKWNCLLPAVYYNSYFHSCSQHLCSHQSSFHPAFMFSIQALNSNKEMLTETFYGVPHLQCFWVWWGMDGNDISNVTLAGVILYSYTRKLKLE